MLFLFISDFIEILTKIGSLVGDMDNQNPVIGSVENQQLVFRQEY